MKYKYKVTGYQEKIGGTLNDITAILVIAENSGKALDKAKKMIKKKHYRVAEVHEINKNTSLEEYNLQNLLNQKYRKKIDAEHIKSNREMVKQMEIQNDYLKRIVKVLERK